MYGVHIATKDRVFTRFLPAQGTDLIDLGTLSPRGNLQAHGGAVFPTVSSALRAAANFIDIERLDVTGAAVVRC